MKLLASVGACGRILDDEAVDDAQHGVAVGVEGAEFGWTPRSVTRSSRSRPHGKPSLPVVGWSVGLTSIQGWKTWSVPSSREHPTSGDRRRTQA